MKPSEETRGPSPSVQVQEPLMVADSKGDRPHVSGRLATRVASVAGIFSLIVCALLLYDFSRRQGKDLVEEPAFRALHTALRQHPDSAVLKEELRATDRRLREEYFRQRTFAQFGALLLCGGIAIFLLAGRIAATIGRPLPNPQPETAVQDWDSRWKPAARVGVAGLGFLLAAAAVAVSVMPRSRVEGALDAATKLPSPPASRSTPGLASREAVQAKQDTHAVVSVAAASPAPVVSAAATPAPVGPVYTPSEAEIRAAWPCFRGPDGSGISPYANVPLTWDGPSGKNIRWKAAVLLPGNSSPLVCGRRIFLTGADEKHRRVFGFDAMDGRLLWQQDVPAGPQAAAPKVNGDTGYAASTPATDGRYVAAIFANGDLAAFDFDGHLAWAKHLGVPDNAYGHAASLTVYGHLLLVPMDQATPQAGHSTLSALEIATGKTVWQKTRPVAASWSTPIVIHHGGRDQLITTANPWVIAYDPRDGTELWRAKCFKQTDVAPSPVFADGLLYAPGNDMSPLCAIRPDGKGDVTATGIVWKAEDNMSDTASPLAALSCVFVVNSSGMVTGFDAKTGDKFWEEDLGDFHVKASPSLVGRRLVLIGEDGKGLILEADRKACKRVGTANVGEPCVATPAFQDGRIYLRGEKHLFCIAAPQASGKQPAADTAPRGKP